MLSRLLVVLSLVASSQCFQPSLSAALRPAARSTLSPQMAGFGGAAAKKGGRKGAKPKVDKKAGLSPRRQWDKFKELVSDGASRHKVYAQFEDKWTEAGEIAVSGGTAAQGAQFNKRLILEHAVRVNPSLLLHARELTAGVEGADGEPAAFGKQEIPAGIVSGFEGLPDASGMYSKVAGTTRNSDPTAIIGSAARNSIVR